MKAARVMVGSYLLCAVCAGGAQAVAYGWAEGVKVLLVTVAVGAGVVALASGIYLALWPHR
jgi:hypothetical protein